ncbi:hypothetical protein Q8F55_001501 [Vanrija albida]|uniref:Uncharacterized protein n=1 Tax=Vanrija albida TaxID=181172 RepID=A0ABR3QG59_9TREE
MSTITPSAPSAASATPVAASTSSFPYADPFWPAPQLVGQALCAATQDNTTRRCCTLLGGAYFVPTAAQAAAERAKDRAASCLLFSNVSTVNDTINEWYTCTHDDGEGVFATCAFRREEAGARRVAAAAVVWLAVGVVLAM